VDTVSSVVMGDFSSAEDIVIVRESYAPSGVLTSIKCSPGLRRNVVVKPILGSDTPVIVLYSFPSTDIITFVIRTSPVLYMLNLGSWAV
jgi:hypothetical protein